MLPPFIIEQIRQRELKERPLQPRLELELELPMEPRETEPNPPDEIDAPRGVVIIDL